MTPRIFSKILTKYAKSTAFNIFFGGCLVFVIIFMVTFAPLLTPFDPLELSSDVLVPPSPRHPFGTDTLGKDIFSRCLYGGRISLLVAFFSILLSSIIGITVGTLSGYIGGAIDRVLLFVADILYAFPVYVMALMITVVLTPTTENIAMAVSVSYFPQYFRIARNSALSLKERSFIESEKIIGAGTFYIVRRHIIPFIMPSMIVIASMGIADSIGTVAGLSFVGLGIQPPTPEWGLDLKLGRDVFLANKWWAITFPGIMIFLTVLGFNLLGEGINTIIKERRVE